jgi:hypothetical protein
VCARERESERAVCVYVYVYICIYIIYYEYVRVWKYLCICEKINTYMPTYTHAKNKKPSMIPG